MHLTIIIGRKYNENTGEIVPLLNTPNVVSQSNDSIYGNFWDMSSEELADAKSNLRWFAEMVDSPDKDIPVSMEFPDKDIPVSMELVTKIMSTPTVKRWQHFSLWFCFWVRQACTYPSSNIQFCFVE